MTPGGITCGKLYITLIKREFSGIKKECIAYRETACGRLVHGEGGMALS
jgi:hypothetical protein